MKFEQYLIDEGLVEIVRNFFSKLAGMTPSQIDYQLKTGWYDFVEKVRKKGSEKEMIDFINKTFHQNIKSLDDVNLSKLKTALVSNK